ncbi:hypothetical protein A2U01_0002270, partial [Trifolium medium]|nr:hypothetical protein [Trifolium medium]
MEGGACAPHAGDNSESGSHASRKKLCARAHRRRVHVGLWVLADIAATVTM